MTVRLLVPTSYITVACMSARRYFDLDAVRTPVSADEWAKAGQQSGESYQGTLNSHGRRVRQPDPAGAPPLDWWEDDRDTVRARLIDMMCPPRVCLTCGEPSRRIVGAATYADNRGRDVTPHVWPSAINDGRSAHAAKQNSDGRTAGVTRQAPTLGWSDCGHDNWRPGIAFDPFSEDGDPMTVRLLVGDVRDRISEIPDGSVDVVMCSPPFLALRKYGDNAAEMGSEHTPADFLDALLELTGEFRRVLAPHGSIAIELGDTYSGSGGAGGDYNDGGLRDGQAKFDGSATKNRRHAGRNDWEADHPIKWNGVSEHHMPTKGNGWPLAKSLTLIPTLYPASLAYGWNMLNPDHTFDRWRVRNVIVWARPNPPVGALGDKVRPATSYITVACTSAKRWFDLDAVRTPFAYGENGGGSGRLEDGVDPRGDRTRMDDRVMTHAGAPPLDWWEDDDPTGHATLVLPTQPYPGAHYATWPETLASRLIRMMCPLRVCTVCGEPSRRIVEATAWEHRSHPLEKIGVHAGGLGTHGDRRAQPTTLGWSDCGHGDKWRPGRILDPFAGSGTTLCVAQGLGRDATGIELYPANAELVRQRVGMFLEVDEGAA